MTSPWHLSRDDQHGNRASRGPGEVALGRDGLMHRVLLLTSHPVDGRDGADKELAVSIARGMPGLNFTFFTRAGQDAPMSGRGVKILSRAGSPGVLERTQVALRVPRLTRSADLVHAVMTIGRQYAAWSRSRWSPRNRPVVLTVPGVVAPECLHRSRPLGVAVALTEVTAGLLRDAGYQDVRVVPPGIDLTRWRHVPRQTANRPVLFFAGHAGADGGTHQAIEVAAGVVRRGVPVRLVLALRTRPGQDESRELAAANVAARTAGLEDVEICGRRDMTEAIAAADVVLFTPDRLADGKADVPLVVIEALASGRPVVATRLPHLAALSDVVVQVPAGAVDEASDRVRMLLTNPVRWQELSIRGRAAVEARFSAERMCRSYASIYRELLKDHRLRHGFP